MGALRPASVVVVLCCAELAQKNNQWHLLGCRGKVCPFQRVYRVTCLCTDHTSRLFFFLLELIHHHCRNKARTQCTVWDRLFVFLHCGMILIVSLWHVMKRQQFKHLQFYCFFPPSVDVICCANLGEFAFSITEDNWKDCKFLGENECSFFFLLLLCWSKIHNNTLFTCRSWGFTV